MKDTDYIAIQAPMVTQLKLSGNNLIIFALIHGYCKDGQHKFSGSIDYICEWTNLSRNTVIATLKLLVKAGLLNKEEKTINHIKFCEYTTNYGGSAESALVVKKYDKGSAESSPNNIYSNTINNTQGNISKHNNISFVEKEKEFIEKIYNMYPTRCPKRNTTLGKCSKDKTRIKNLLKTYSMEDIEKVVKYEVESKYGNKYMSNFSTFLNNFPDPQCLFGEKNKSPEPSEDNITIGNIEYR